MNPGLETRLRGTSDTLLATLEELQDLEDAKRDAPPGTKLFRDLAEQVERLAASVFQLTVTQHDLAVEAQVTGTTIDPIDEQLRPTAEILADWRAAERRLAAARPGTDDHASATIDVDRFRAEYQRVFEARRMRSDD